MIIVRGLIGAAVVTKSAHFDTQKKLDFKSYNKRVFIQFKITYRAETSSRTGHNCWQTGESDDSVTLSVKKIRKMN
jgi:hypothetical protein